MALPAVGALAAGACVAAGHLPLLSKFFQDLWDRPQYQFFPLVLLGAAWLGYERLRDAPVPSPRRGERAAALSMLLAALALLAAGAGLYARWLAAAAVFAALAGGATWFGGLRLLRRLLPAAVLVLAVIPPPMHLDNALTLALRGLAVRSSSRLLDAMGVAHHLSGVVIDLPGRRLLVAEACSGINSLMTIAAFALLLGFRNRRPAWAVVLLLGASVLLVVWVNTLRIVVGAWAGEVWHVDFFSHSLHGLFGWALFALSLALVLSADRLLAFASGDGGAAVQREAKAAQRRREPRQWDVASPSPLPAPAPRLTWAGAALALSFLAVGIATQVRVGKAWPSPRLRDGATFSLPPRLTGWDRVGGGDEVTFRPQLVAGESHLWNYELSGGATPGGAANASPASPIQAVVAIDYTFSGYHDVTVCYATSGWSIGEDAVRVGNNNAGADRAGPFRELDMSQRVLGHGYLWFALVDETGRSLRPDEHPAWGTDLVATLRQPAQVAATPVTYQIQVLVHTDPDKALTAEQRAAARRLFLESRAELVRQILSQLRT